MPGKPKTTKAASTRSASKKALQAEQRPLSATLKDAAEALRAYFSYKIAKLKKGIADLPTWVKTRPRAIKQWIKEDRKKKKYRSFRLQKRVRPEPRYIPTSVELLKSTGRFLWQHKKVFLGIIFIHAVVYLAVLRAPIDTNINTIEGAVETVLGDNAAQTSKGTLATLGTVLSVAGSSQTSGILTTLSTLFMSFVYIWAIRELHANKSIKARDAYYRGMAPLFSSAMVFIVASLQLIPFALASFFYISARSNGLFVSGFEDLSFFLITVLLGLLSGYWMTSTVMAFYIVTLPGMYPVESLKAAKKLISFERFKVFRRIIALPIVLGVAYFLILLGVIRFISQQAFVAVELLQLVLLPIVHTYLYKLYRALI